MNIVIWVSIKVPYDIVGWRNNWYITFYGLKCKSNLKKQGKWTAGIIGWLNDLCDMIAEMLVSQDESIVGVIGLMYILDYRMNEKLSLGDEW